MVDERAALDELEHRLNAILPEEYQDCYEEVEPVSMGSAGLRFGSDGKVAWDEMWASFCDLAMAGGPPHKGKLLEPPSLAEIEAQPEQYAAVVEEICRGIIMATDLPAQSSPSPGWVRVGCYSKAMAGWLHRAIVMENVAVRADGETLDVPAGPDFRIDKEIKNVVTVMAKTSHYWLGHTSRDRKQTIGQFFEMMAEKAPLVEPMSPNQELQAHDAVSAQIAESIHREIGLAASNHRYTGWLGVECRSVHAAIWMMRALVVANVLSRREGTVLFVPVNPFQDPSGDRVVGAAICAHRLARIKGVL